MSSTIKFLDLSLHDLIDKLNPELRSIDNFDGKERKREFYAMSPEGHEILDEETAAEVAKEAQVKQLILTHISARYLTKEAYQLQEEAQEIFPNTKIVKDMDIIEIPFANEGGA